MLPRRFREKFVRHASGCWLWTGARSVDGYGFFHLPAPRRLVRAHRFAYENTRGPIPLGKQLDHLCRVPACVNPDHLRVVTGRENTLSGDGPTAVNARKAQCPKGHPLSGENLYVCPRGKRRCRICRKTQWGTRAVPGLAAPEAE